MERKVICVGTIWDLDEWVYPELDDFSGMRSGSFRHLVKFQLTSSRKEMKNVVKMPLFQRNQYGIRVRACCASCLLKEMTQNGKRICKHHQCKVDALDKCGHWMMAEVLQDIGK